MIPAATVLRVSSRLARASTTRTLLASKHTLPDLPYDYNALEPYISADIMKIHHQKHHQTYINNLNVAEEKQHELINKNDLVSQIALQGALKFNGGGHINHSIFWTVMAPPKQGGGEPPKGALLNAINKDFGSLEAFTKSFNASTVAVQGSGWGWLGYNKAAKRLEIVTTANQDPLTQLVPLLGVDVWEHAYYLQYKNVRPDYLDAIWHVINWKSRRGAHDIVQREGSNKVFVRAGPGGRSSVSGHTATVFGSTGFLGRYLVNNLGKRGTQVVVPFRGNDDNKRHLKLMGDLGQIVPLRFDVRDEKSVAECVRHSDVVYNLIGRDYETKNFTYDQVNVDAARTVARIAREEGVSRLIHVSALNADVNSPSKYLRTKALGEEAVLSEFPDATIVRPATCFGYEDRFLNRIGWYLVWPPALPIAGNGMNKIRPVYAPDVTLVLARLLNDSQSMGQVVELPGPTEFYYYSFIKMFCEVTRRSPPIVYIPKQLAKIVPTFMDKLMAFPIDTPDSIERQCIDDRFSKASLSFADYDVTPHTIYETIGQFARLFVSQEYQNAPLNIPRNYSTDAINAAAQ
ncbi:hypothetical protein SmJEL517_g02888 [Synchytrium microbalum]|uniref:superoxide dismutase n=1 Tax=Synchytrium microbalum TaxID=1806994 RepID=A0A507C4Q3_9FUNG|nr:uncharacterized protein SmJEL517_g02888 [Synchytrium microbalum]TPX34461.1 hypothetical protein SmJEL517_g02888 [Synchytrium microbalum]